MRGSDHALQTHLLCHQSSMLQTQVPSQAQAFEGAQAGGVVGGWGGVRLVWLSLGL